MKTLPVNLGERSYDIVIGPDSLKRLHEFFEKYRIGKRVFVLSNPSVFQLYGQELRDGLSKSGSQVTEILIPEGEKHKNLHTVENIYTYLIAQRADRSSTLVALGGGVTGDIAGFVAATFLRGIPYVQIPTTLVAQVDSSVGGKTGVNHHLGKNLIGAFYQPHLVVVDINTLASLPEREFQSGLYEIIKYGLIYDADFFQYFEDHLEQLRERTPEVLEHTISRCCEIKGEIVSQDERENDLRRILNFGHTFGHALEAAMAFRGLTHGEAIAYGMLAASRISAIRGLIDSATCERIEVSLRRIGNLPPIKDIPTHRVREAMDRDKKRQEGRIAFVLLKGIGKAVIEVDLEEQFSEIWEPLRLELAT